MKMSLIKNDNRHYFHFCYLSQKVMDLSTTGLGLSKKGPNNNGVGSLLARVQDTSNKVCLRSADVPTCPIHRHGTSERCIGN